MEKLSPAKQALLEKWLQGQQPVPNKTSIPRRPLNSPIIISLPQRRHLFLELLDRGTPVNNLSVFLQLVGTLDEIALEKSANQILARHEVLRTSFSFDTGIPTPNISNILRINIPIINLQDFNEKDQESEARRLAEWEVLQPFNLSQVPLIRLILYKLGKEKFVLLLTAHHTIADGWSLGVFLKELMAFYQANTTGKDVQLPELPIQYFDYALWQADEKNQAGLQSSMYYWKKQLGGELPVLELPTDRARSTKQTFTGGTHRFVISKDVTKALEELSRREDATLFMTLLTAFYLLLHQYSGQDDILVGTPVANRNLPEIQHLIGIFINTLVLRANLSEDLNFLELLRQVRQVSLEAYSHQDFPFEKLVETLKPKRELSRPPLFQVLFNLQNAPMPKLEIAGIGTAFLEIDRGVSQFDMTLMISQVENQCHATVEYNSDLFQPATIERMFRSYQMLLENVVSQPDLKICQLQLMDQEEFHRIVYALNHTEVDFPREKCIHRLIEEQAGKTPNSIALIFNESQLTYRELNQRANVLARQLQELGVGPEVRVGILMKRSMEVVVALLGVLKAGGAYVPVPAATPIQRVQFFLKDSDAQVLLTNIYFQQSYEFDGHIINLNDKVFQSGTDSSNLSTFIRPDNLAYVIYTSGSTGQPKGVMVEHRSLVNFLWFMKGRPGMDEKNVVLALTSIGFDISIMELFLPLLTGAKVVIASDEMTTSPLMISETINRHNVNFVQATPATWQLLLDWGWTGAPGLKALCGGDVLARRMADRLLKCVSSLWNLYGPTETTVWSSVGEVKADNNPITIGQPIGNTQMYILDRYQQPVPIGVIGELYISGAGLARAYLNSPELTREKFIPNRFSTETSSRLYKTGDRARYLPDFNIEVLGRIDDQVKVQGHRVELGEITAVLMEHPALTDAIVIARQESTGETRLVAYFVSKHDPSPEPGKLREFLGKKLPAYMIPVFFVKMDVLPLTSSRKVDRKALPVPEASRHRSLYIAPRNEEEQILAQIWQNVLDVEQVGIEDNFFDLGGASIQSIQVVSEAYMYGYLISVANIFEYSTIAQLAKQINFKSNNAEEEQHALDQQTC